MGEKNYIMDTKGLCSTRCVHLAHHHTYVLCGKYNTLLEMSEDGPNRAEACRQRTDSPTDELHDWYAAYISRAMKFAEHEANAAWPRMTRIVVKNYSPLASFQSVGGMEILVCDMPSSFEFFVAVPNEQSANAVLQKAFAEYCDLYPFVALDEVEE